MGGGGNPHQMLFFKKEENRKAHTYGSCEKLQSCEWKVICFDFKKLRDCDKAEVHKEWKNVEHQEPREENEVRADAGPKLAANDLKSLLPKLEELKKFWQAIFKLPKGL